MSHRQPTEYFDAPVVSVELQDGYSAVVYPVEHSFSELSFEPNKAYERYLKMHKVFVGKGGAEHLETIFNDLKTEQMPRYLSAAGWAAAEAAVVHKDMPTMERLELLDEGAKCWEQAIANQLHLNELGNEYPHLIEHSSPYRMAMDVAASPLLRGLILGDVTEQTCRDVFADCLAIAQANYLHHELAVTEGDMEAANDHLGFAYECNAMLALNRMYSRRWFAIPTMARSDSGYYHPEQTHDLLIIRRKGSDIQSLVPVEIKAAASLKERSRYLALLVRGKMHLCLEGSGNHLPRATLDAITAVHSGVATKHETLVADTISRRFMQMLSDYYAGDVLDAGSELTVFHDKSLVSQRHAGLGTFATRVA